MNNGITESREIDAPAEAVWALICDVRALPGVLSGMTALDVHGDDASMRVGLSWTQTRVIRGHSGSEGLRVTALDPWARYVTEGGSHGFGYVTTWEVQPLDGGRSRLSCTFLGIPHSLLARALYALFGRSGDKASRDAIRTDLDDIARVVTGGTR